MIESKPRNNSLHLSLAKRSSAKIFEDLASIVSLNEKNKLQSEEEEVYLAGQEDHSPEEKAAIDNQEEEEAAAESAANFLLELPTPDVMKDFSTPTIIMEHQNPLVQKDQIPSQMIPTTTTSSSSMRHLNIPITPISTHESLNTPEVNRENYLPSYSSLMTGQETPQTSGPYGPQPNFGEMLHAPTPSSTLSTHTMDTVSDDMDLFSSLTTSDPHLNPQPQEPEPLQYTQYYPHQHGMIHTDPMLPETVRNIRCTSGDEMKQVEDTSTSVFSTHHQPQPSPATFSSNESNSGNSSAGEGSSSYPGDYPHQYQRTSKRKISEDSGSGSKKNKPTKKQQYDDLKEKEKSLEAENEMLRSRVKKYESACVALKKILVDRMSGKGQ